MVSLVFGGCGILWVFPRMKYSANPGNPSKSSIRQIKLYSVAVKTAVLAIKLYEVGRLSMGQAAKVAGYSKRAFMEILGHYHVPIFAYSPDDLAAEVDLLS